MQIDSRYVWAWLEDKRERRMRRLGDQPKEDEGIWLAGYMSCLNELAFWLGRIAPRGLAEDDEITAPNAEDEMERERQP
jgi:hypothetical protein